MGIQWRQGDGKTSGSGQRSKQNEVSSAEASTRTRLSRVPFSQDLKAEAKLWSIAEKWRQTMRSRPLSTAEGERTYYTWMRKSVRNNDDSTNETDGTAEGEDLKWVDVANQARLAKQNMMMAKPLYRPTYLGRIEYASSGWKTWLKALPDDGCRTCILWAFMQIIMESQMIKFDDKALEAACTVTQVLENVPEESDHYVSLKHSYVEPHAVDLYFAVVRVLTYLLEYLRDCRTYYEVKSSHRPSYPKVNVDHGMEEIRERARRMEDVVQQLPRRNPPQGDTDEERPDFRTPTPAFLRESAYVESGSHAHGSQDPADRLQHNNINPQDVSGGVMDKFYASLKSGPETTHITIPWHRRLRNMKERIVRARTTSNVTAKTFLEIMHYDPSLIELDIETNIEVGPELDRESRSKIGTLLNDAQFEQFLKEDTASTALLVNCWIYPRQESPLSFFAAHLAQVSRTMKEEENIFTVMYFCWENMPQEASGSYGDSISLVARMVISLIGQLLWQMLEKGIDVDSDTLFNHIQEEEESIWSFKTVCQMFADLIAKLPRGSNLFCVIDEISDYEYEEQDDVNIFMEHLIGLVESSDSVLMKLLCTCKDSARGCSFFFKGRTLNIGKDGEGDDENGDRAYTASLAPQS